MPLNYLTFEQIKYQDLYVSILKRGISLLEALSKGDINKQYAEKGFRVISINLDAEKHLADKFLLETPADFAVIFDAKGLTAKKFKLKGMPSSFLINKEGKIIITHSGFFSDKKPLYQKEIESLLAE